MLPSIKNLLLTRSTRTIVHFNDVFTERYVDFDATLTTSYRNTCPPEKNWYFPIGKNPKSSDYGVVLLNDLEEEQLRIIHIAEKLSKNNNTPIHPDIIKRIESMKKAPIAIINIAPRNKETTIGGKNGKDFFLAITNNHVEIYTTSLERLRDLETRCAIIALYVIPNEKHPFFDGKHEQFRSSVITNARISPDFLEPLFEYNNQEELIQARIQKKHPSLIPTQETLGEFAFADKFGNVRVTVKNVKLFQKYLEDNTEDKMVGIQVGDSEIITAHNVNSLSEIPDGELGIYQNIADPDGINLPLHEDIPHGAYFEIVHKSFNPNKEQFPAITVLKSLNKNFKNDPIFLAKPNKNNTLGKYLKK